MRKDDFFFPPRKYLILNYDLLFSILIKLHSEHVLATFIHKRVGNTETDHRYIHANKTMRIIY